jgi:hypothetical protein
MNNPIIDNIYNQADMLLASCNGLAEEFEDYEDITTDELQLMSMIESQAEALYLAVDLLKCGLKNEQRRI